MNKNYIIGGALAILVLLGIAYFAMNKTSMTAINTDGSTPVTSTDGTQTVDPSEDPIVDASPAGAKPVPTTNATVAPYDTTAVVTGTVNPSGAITTYWYEYGTTKDLGKKTSAQVVGSGSTAIATPGYITGLTKATMYFYKLVAQNEFGTVSGLQNSFTTKSFGSAPVGGIPMVTTSAAAGVNASSATLKATVNPNKSATKYWFEIGKGGTLGGVTAFVDVGDGSSATPVSATAANLDAGTTYYYRINAQNQFGTVNGAILTFKTAGKAPVTQASPVVTTQVVGTVAANSAVAVGTVNPYGAQTSYWFEYGTDASFAASATKSTQKKSAGAVSTTVTGQATLSDLKANTKYFVRIVASNSGGTVRGDVQTFQTK